MKTKTLICSTCGTPYTPGDPDWDDTERIPVHMDWGMVGQMSEPRVCGSGVEAGAEPTVSAAMDLIRTRILVDSPCDRWADLGPKIRGAVEVVEAAREQVQALTLERDEIHEANEQACRTWAELECQQDAMQGQLDAANATIKDLTAKLDRFRQAVAVEVEPEFIMDAIESADELLDAGKHVLLVPKPAPGADGGNDAQ
jgi:hypothetical protein